MLSFVHCGPRLSGCAAEPLKRGWLIFLFEFWVLKIRLSTLCRSITLWTECWRSRREDSIGGTYHLTNPVPTKNGFWLPNICRILGVEGIRLVGESSFVKTPTSKLEALFQKQMTFYYQYLQGEPRFDCRRVLEALN